MSEIDVLRQIEQDSTSTQRDIAKNTGLSLGMVNILLKRLVKKGLIKMERLTPRKIKYILTPEGIKRLTTVTYSYIVSSINYLNRLEGVINEVIERYEGKNIMLYGKKDEVFSVLKSKLDHHGTEYMVLNNLEEIHKILNKNQDGNRVVITWNPECCEELEKKNIRYFCLLDKL